MIGGKEQSFYTVKDVAPSTFIKAYANHLRNTNKIKIPDWLTWVKTGVRQEYAPYDPDWVYVRSKHFFLQIVNRRQLFI
jgi:small subunit ribosomal protein S19e